VRGNNGECLQLYRRNLSANILQSCTSQRIDRNYWRYVGHGIARDSFPTWSSTPDAEDVQNDRLFHDGDRLAS
jgi:hypothetical protein